MRWTKIYFLALLICGVIGCQIGCGHDVENALVEQNISDEEVLTKQKLYETADGEIRWKKSRAARKRYIKLRDKYPDAALKAYIEYRNWMHHGHPLATEVAKMSAKMDMAGKTHIPEMLKFLNLELEMANDLQSSEKHIEELEENILFWTELAKDLKIDGEDPADFEIQYEIGEGID
jgi:hypothetical protein